MDLVLLAILMHKVSETFGYGAFLFNNGVRGQSFYKYLAAFTGSCPLVAVLTFFIMKIALEGSGGLAVQKAVAILLIFSAGSLLYVATVHILAELLNGHSHDHFGEGHDEIPLETSGKAHDHKKKQNV